MDLGLFIMPMHPPEKSRTVGFDEDLELLCRAEDLGLTEAWIGEHMTCHWESIPSPDLFLAYAFAHTKTIRLGTGVYLLALHHPADIASRASMLDHLSKGRFNFGIGTGGIPSDRPFKGVTVDQPEYLARFSESLEIILKLWTEDPPWAYKGKFWNVELEGGNMDISLGYPLKPYSKPHMPVGVPGMGMDSPSIRMAGERGWMALSTNFVSAATLANHRDTYRKALASKGHPSDQGGWRVCREVVVADTDREAIDYARNGAMGQAFNRYMLPLTARSGAIKYFKNDPDMPDSDVTVDYLIRDTWIVGSPETVVEKIDKLQSEAGPFDTLLMIGHDWDDKSRAVNSLELLAKKVLPSLN